MNRVSVILLCATALTIFLILKEKPKLDIKKYEDQIKTLQSEISGLESLSDSLQVHAAVLEAQVQQYDSIVDQLNNEINVIEEETKRKLDAIDAYNRGELQRFFSDYTRKRLDNSTGN